MLVTVFASSFVAATANSYLDSYCPGLESGYSPNADSYCSNAGMIICKGNGANGCPSQGDTLTCAQIESQANPFGPGIPLTGYSESSACTSQPGCEYVGSTCQLDTADDCTELITKISSDDDIILGNDIDCSGATFSSWPSKLFTSNFNGQNYTISNVYIDGGTSANVGLLPRAYSQVQIKDLKINNITVIGGNEVAALIGHAEQNTANSGEMIKNVHIYNATVLGSNGVGGILGEHLVGSINTIIDTVTFQGTINASGSSSEAGGIVGEANRLNVTNATTYGSVTSRKTAGGIGGEMFTQIHINNSMSYMTVQSNENINVFLGGIVGEIRESPSSVQNSGYNGSILAIDTAQSSSRVGGLVGFLNGAHIYKSYASTFINTSTDYVGGLIGYANSFISITPTVLESYSQGLVIGRESVGGALGGANSVEINNSYSRAVVISSLRDAGSFIGEMTTNAKLNKTYGTGQVTGVTNAGGFAGTATGTIENSFFDNQTTSKTTSTGSGSSVATGKSTSDMQTQSTFTDAGWDFTNIWKISAGNYPQLKWVLQDSDGDGIDDDSDPVLGTEDTIEDTGIDAQFEIDGSATILTSYADENLTVEIKDGSNSFIEFKHNFQQSSLSLSGVTIKKTGDGILVSGLTLQSGQTKNITTTYNTGKVCVKDSSISSLSEISEDCDQADEGEFNESECSVGTTKTINGNSISCTLSGGYYKINGLSNSGILGSNAQLNTSTNYTNNFIAPNETTVFYANYSSTNGSAILGASCIFEFEGNGTYQNLTYNATTQIYNYTVPGGFDQFGASNYTINCSGSAHETLSVTDDITFSYFLISINGSRSNLTVPFNSELTLNSSTTVAQFDHNVTLRYPNGSIYFSYDGNDVNSDTVTFDTSGLWEVYYAYPSSGAPIETETYYINVTSTDPELFFNLTLVTKTGSSSFKLTGDFSTQINNPPFRAGPHRLEINTSIAGAQDYIVVKRNGVTISTGAYLNDSLNFTTNEDVLFNITVSGGGYDEQNIELIINYTDTEPPLINLTNNTGQPITFTTNLLHQFNFSINDTAGMDKIIFRLYNASSKDAFEAVGTSGGKLAYALSTNGFISVDESSLTAHPDGTFNVTQTGGLAVIDPSGIDYYPVLIGNDSQGNINFTVGEYDLQRADYAANVLLNGNTATPNADHSVGDYGDLIINITSPVPFNITYLNGTKQEKTAGQFNVIDTGATELNGNITIDAATTQNYNSGDFVYYVNFTDEVAPSLINTGRTGGDSFDFFTPQSHEINSTITDADQIKEVAFILLNFTNFYTDLHANGTTYTPDFVATAINETTRKYFYYEPNETRYNNCIDAVLTCNIDGETYSHQRGINNLSTFIGAVVLPQLPGNAICTEAVTNITGGSTDAGAIGGNYSACDNLYNLNTMNISAFDNSLVHASTVYSLGSSITNSANNYSIDFNYEMTNLNSSNADYFYIWSAIDNSDNDNFSISSLNVGADETLPLAFDPRPIADTAYNPLTTIEIAVNATDATGIDVVIANITLPNGTEDLRTLSSVIGNKYNVSYTVPDIVGLFNVSFIVNDATGNFNLTTKTNFTANDIRPPYVMNVLADPSSLAQTESVKLNATVTDQSIIDKVIANITLANGTEILLPMTNVAGDLYSVTYATSIFTPVGQQNVRIIANDTSGNLNITETTSFTVGDSVNPQAFDPRPFADVTVTPLNSIQIAINATDNADLDTVRANITLPDSSNTIIVLSNAIGNKYNNSYSVPNQIGTFNITYLVNDTSNNLNNTAKTNFTTTDINAPAITALLENPVDPSTYNVATSYTFNATISDNVALDSVLFELDGINNTPTGSNGNNYYYTITTLAAGTHSYTWHSNDTTGNYNSSSATYNVNKNSSVIELKLNGNQANQTVEAGQSVTINLTKVSGEGSVELFVNTGSVDTHATQIDNLTSFTNIGLVNVTGTYTETQNYTGSTVTYYFNVTDTTAPTVTGVVATPNTINQVSSVEINATVGDAIEIDTVLAEFTLSNGTKLNQTMTLFAGTYNTTYTTTIQHPIGTQTVKIIANDTSGNVNNTQTTTFTVNDVNAPTLSTLTEEPADPATYGPGSIYAFNVTITDNTALDTVKFELNGVNNTPIQNGNIFTFETSGALPAGVQSYTWHANDTSGNYNSLSSTYTINKASSDIELKLNGNEANQTIEAGQSITINLTKVAGEGSVELFVNTGSVDTHATQVDNLTSFNTLGLVNVTGTYAETQNYTGSTVTYYFNVTDTIAPTVTGVVAIPSAINQGASVDINATVTDQSAIDKVIANITLANGSEVLLPMTNVAGDLYSVTYATSTFTPVGQQNVRIIANDTSGNLNITETTSFAVGDNINPQAFDPRPFADVTVTPLNSIQIAINATDNVALDTVRANITLPDSSNTIIVLSNAIGNKYNNSYSVPNQIGTFNITYLVNDTSNNLNNTAKTNFTTTDINAPGITSLIESPADPSTYNVATSYTFNATISDNVALDSVLFELDGINNTPTGSNGNNYYYTITTLAAGTHSYTWHSNDTTGNYNSSSATYTVNKNSGVIELKLNGNQANQTVEVGQSVTINLTKVSGEGSVELFVNTGSVDTHATQIDNLTSFTNIGLVNVTGSYTETQNYTGSTVTYYFNVTDTTAPTVTGVVATPNTINQGSSVEINATVGDAIGIDTVLAEFTLSNGTKLNQTMTLFAGTYNTTYTTTIQHPIGTQTVKIIANDTSGNVNNTQTTTFTVNDVNAPTLSTLTEEPADPATYGPGSIYAFNVTVTDNTALDTVKFELNGVNNTPIQNGNIFTFETSVALPAGVQSYTWHANDTSGNYNSLSSTYTINKASSEIELKLNGNEANQTIEAGQSVTINLTKVAGEGSVELFVNTGSVDTDATKIDNLTSFNTLGLVNVTGTYTETQNYTGSTVTYYFNVTDTNAPTVTGVVATPNTINQISSVEINATVGDAIGIDTVIAEFTLSNGTKLNQTMTLFAGTYNTTYTTTIQNPIGTQTVKIIANDTSGNVNNTQTTTFTVSDNINPLIVAYVNQIVSNFSPTGITNLTINGTDNTQINTTAILIIDGVENLVTQNGDLFTKTDVYSGGIHYYNWTVSDSSGNSNTSLTYNFTINSTLPNATLLLNNGNVNVSVPTGSLVNITANLSIPQGANYELTGDGLSTIVSGEQKANITNLTAKQSYVQLNFTGNENYSALIIVRGIEFYDTVSPDSLYNLSSSNVTNQSVTISFNQSNAIDFDRYEIYRDNILIVNTTSLTNTTHNLIGLTPSTTYNITVLTYDINGNNGSTSILFTTSNYSNTSSLQLDSTTPNNNTIINVSQSFVIQFNQNITNVNVNDIILKENGTVVDASIEINGTDITIISTRPLNPNSTITLIINSTLKDENNTALGSTQVYNYTLGLIDTDKDGTADIYENGAGEDKDGDTLNNTVDNVLGNGGNLHSNLNNLSVTIDNESADNISFTGTKEVIIYQDDIEIIKFNHDFTNGIDFNNISIIREENNDNFELIISGVDVEKSVQFKHNSTNNENLCIIDAETVAFTTFTDDCSDTNEKYIVCDGVTSDGYTCTYTSATSTFNITGLQHSGAKPICAEDWTAGSFGTCIGGTQTRTVTDQNNCGTSFTKPATSQSCTVSSSSSAGGGGGGGGSSGSYAACEPNYECTGWSDCVNGEQTRRCIDKNQCSFPTVRPTLVQECTIEQVIEKDESETNELDTEVEEISEESTTETTEETLIEEQIASPTNGSWKLMALYGILAILIAGIAIRFRYVHSKIGLLNNGLAGGISKTNTGIEKAKPKVTKKVSLAAKKKVSKPSATGQLSSVKKKTVAKPEVKKVKKQTKAVKQASKSAAKIIKKPRLEIHDFNELDQLYLDGKITDAEYKNKLQELLK